MTEILIKGGQLLLSLSLLVVLHELGHFLPAKYFKCKVEKFYLFFEYKFSLFKKKIGETEYGIGWIPLGGYVKIAGMVDESMDKDHLNQEPQPWEFRSKPAWQRLIILLGGIIVNFIIAIVLYAMIAFVWGEKTVPLDNMKYGILVDELGANIGLEDGDKILRIDGKKPATFRDLRMEMVLGNTLEIDRMGTPMTLEITDEQKKNILNKGKKAAIIALPMPAQISGLDKGNEAEKAGLKVGDELIGFNGNPMLFATDFSESIPQYANDSISLDIMRKVAGKEVEMSIPVLVNKDSAIGIGFNTDMSSFYDIVNTEYSFGEAVGKGFEDTWGALDNYIRQFKLLFNPKVEGYKHLGGFLTIGSIFPDTWDWLTFWNITAFLSVILGFMNLLPIPGLDGGHALFVVYELITGKKPAEKFMEKAVTVGVVILIALMLFANGNDIFKLFNPN